MATKHDQLMKELLASFPHQFLRLAAKEIADRLDLDTVILEPEEHYPGTPTGRERRPDLVSRARVLAGEDGEDEGEVLLHVEIELRYRGSKRPKLLSYQRGLSLKYALPVHTIVLYLHGGPVGSQSQVYEERSLGRVVGSIAYYSLGLSRVQASEYLVKPEPLAWAFAVLTRPNRGQSRATLGLDCVRRIVETPDLDRHARSLLLQCVWTYGRFEGREAEEFDKIMAELEDEEVQAMKMSMKEWWTKEARDEGVRQGEASVLKRLLRRRFNQLPNWIDQRLEQASRQELEGWADRVLDAERLEDVFSSA